jgi:single-strand DNA-binding protein
LETWGATPPVTNFNLAANRSYKKGDEKVEEVTWFRVTVWRQMAEVCNQYLAKGRQVLVEGRLIANEYGSPRVWETSEGDPRASFEINAETVRFLGGGNGDGGQQEAPAEPMTEDEIPF